MLTVRIIPCLDVDRGKVVKGIKFRDLKYAGDPVDLARYYNDLGADELILLDVTASVEKRKTMLRVVEKVAQKVFIPFCVGGGISNVDDMQNLLRAGADKVAICTAALKNPDLIKMGAELFGSQCIVVSIDAQRIKNTWHCFTHGGRIDSGWDAVKWARLCARLGAGEILLNSIDRDGTQLGYDIKLTRTISTQVKIPVIASGGAGSLVQIYQVIEYGRADAVLLASALHYKKLTIPSIKTYLKRKGVNVRW